MHMLHLFSVLFSPAADLNHKELFFWTTVVRYSESKCGKYSLPVATETNNLFYGMAGCALLPSLDTQLQTQKETL